MINNLINELEDTIEAHESFMMFAHSIGLQGLKRFNRYEAVENLKRVHELKNYMTEFNMGTYTRNRGNAVKSVSSYHELIDALINNRRNLIRMIEEEYAASTDLSYCDYLTDYNEDFVKELEVLSRLKQRLSYISNEDMKKLYLFDWDHDMHEYVKKKEA